MPSFNCFLSHNSKDKPAVRALRQALQAQGLPWQSLLPQGLKGAGSVAVCVGADGRGPWEDEEQQAALQLAVRDGRPVIPVRLPGAPTAPDLPLFLTNRTWVNPRDALRGERLAWPLPLELGPYLISGR